MPDAGLGQWMLGFASFIAFAYYGRMLWLSFVPKNGYVTKADIKEFQTYVRDKLHKNSDDLHALALAVAEIRIAMGLKK